MPSTTSSEVSIDLASSTVMTPSLPTFSIASAMILPMVSSLLAEMVPTCAMAVPLTGLACFFSSATTASTAFSMPRFSSIGLAPATTFLAPSRKIACASTVAVVVPSPAVSDVLLATSRTIWAPMFSSGSLRSISLATVTPSLVIVGEPNFLSRTTLRPFGPRVTLTASASWLTPRSTAWRDCSPYTICFAISVSCFALLLFLGVAGGARAVFDHGQHFVLAHDEVLLTIELDFLAGILAEEDLVARFDIERDSLAVVLGLALAGGNHLALLRFFLGGIGDDDAPHLLFAFFDALDNDAVVQRSDVHACAPFVV